jgi:hypothetical protein
VAEFRRPFDEPVVREAFQSLPGNPVGAAGPPVGPRNMIAQASGVWNCCDVWVQWGQDWVVNAPTLYLQGESGPITTYYEMKVPADLDLPFEPQGIGTGQQSGILFSVRGRACERFTLGAFITVANLSRAHFRLHCWGQEDGAETDRAGRQIVTPYASRGQTIQTTIGPLAAGANVLYPQHPFGRRNYITRIVIVNEAVAGQVPLQLDDFNLVTGLSTTISNYQTTRDNPTVDNLTIPMRGELNTEWHIVAPIVPGRIWVNSTGFAE